MKKIVALCMTGVMMFALAACGSSESTETEKEETKEEETTTEESSEAKEDKTYTYTEDRGDFTIDWKIMLKSDGTYTLEETHGMSGEVTNHSGDEWTDNGDGTFYTGPWSEAGDMSEFFESDGSCVWIDNGDGTATPANAEGGEDEVGDKEGESESKYAGTYTYAEDRGDFTIDWTITLNEDGTFTLEEVHGLSGESTKYTGNEWFDHVDEDGTIVTGAWNEDGDKSEFFDEDGVCTWKYNGDGTLTPEETK